MTPRHMALAALVSTIWGFAFVASKIGLESFSAPQLTALRFMIAALPILVLPRPLPWRALIPTGLTLFTGQFLLLFLAIRLGMPPGLASVTQQIQAFFTVLMAAVFLRDAPTARQTIGMAVSFSGLGLIALTIGGTVSATAFALAIAAALSWAVGNVLVKRRGAVPMLPLMAWLSLVPPGPALFLASLDPGPSIFSALANASWPSLASALYLGAAATALVYAVWGRLLTECSTALIAPFTLLAPCVGVIASAVVFGERFGATRGAGMALVLCGVAIPARFFPKRGDPRALP